jgi:hypothetical protein
MVLCRKEISYLKMSQKEREQLYAEFQILEAAYPSEAGEGELGAGVRYGVAAESQESRNQRYKARGDIGSGS